MREILISVAFLDCFSSLNTPLSRFDFPIALSFSLSFQSLVLPLPLVPLTLPSSHPLAQLLPSLPSFLREIQQIQDQLLRVKVSSCMSGVEYCGLGSWCGDYWVMRCWKVWGLDGIPPGTLLVMSPHEIETEAGGDELILSFLMFGIGNGLYYFQHGLSCWLSSFILAISLWTSSSRPILIRYILLLVCFSSIVLRKNVTPNWSFAFFLHIFSRQASLYPGTVRSYLWKEERKKISSAHYQFDPLAVGCCTGSTRFTDWIN